MGQNNKVATPSVANILFRDKCSAPQSLQSENSNKKGKNRETVLGVHAKGNWGNQAPGALLPRGAIMKAVMCAMKMHQVHSALVPIMDRCNHYLPEKYQFSKSTLA